MRRILLLLALAAISFTGCKPGGSAATEGETGGVYIRYNYLGYNPARNKRIVIMAERDITGQRWTLTNRTTGQQIDQGTFGPSMYPAGDHLPFDYNFVIDFSTLREIGEYELSTEGAESAVFPIKINPYGDIIKAPLHWMRVSRCGSEDAIDHDVCHLGDTLSQVHHRVGIDNGSWHDDGNGKVYDGSGGWHDAADYLKFSLTIGYANYYILRAYDMNPEIFQDMKEYSTTKYNDLLDEAKWGLDWLMKTMPDDDEFIIMVANSEDHNVGYRLPEHDELDGQRPMLSALSPVQMGYASASLALGAQIFANEGDTELAQQYGDMAERIYARAISSDAEASAWLNDQVNAFYGDETVNDNLALAAGELYKWSNKPEYKADAIKYSDLARGAGWKAWESVNLAAHMNIMDTIYPIAKNYVYLDLDAFLANSRGHGNIWGIPMKYVWGGLYSYIGVGASAIEYQVRTNDRKYESLAENMIDYLLGYNNWGICFVAVENVPNAITDPYSQVYNLQADKFPYGAISEGPGDRQSWEKFDSYFGFDPRAERTHKFNTRAGVFYDKRKDFMCMETTIAGVADGLYMLAVASKHFND